MRVGRKIGRGGGQPVAAPPGVRLRISGRAVLTLAVIAFCFVLLANRLSDIRWSDVASAMAATPPKAMLLALVFGLLSHFALACYDLLAFSRIGRKVPWPRALKGGLAGAVMSQVLGFGLITGSLARARIYRANGVSPGETVALSGFVATGFFLGLGVVLTLLLLADPSVAAAVTGLAPWAVRTLAGAGLSALVLCGILGSLWPRRLQVGKVALRLPDLRRPRRPERDGGLGRQRLYRRRVPGPLLLGVMRARARCEPARPAARGENPW